ncbi:MAG TPA: GTPase domain-containing protein, partial [Gemmataceae bacterium]|nr:GTPase domain-containing protein [Gemmataceae bacterium]
MSEVPATQPLPPPVKANGLRIVLFGMPAAGKSSLLGALAQAAEIQQHILHGRITDSTHGLEELQHRLYAERPQRTADEIVPYPIRFEPFAVESLNGSTTERLDATLIDCDGRVANDLLVRKEALREDSPEGTLAREVLDADTLLLVVDASAPPAQVEDDFNEFGRFLSFFERSRGQRSEVSGLPVFLVLTKCDLLAQPNDKVADWIEHIEERKRQVNDRFHAFLDRAIQGNGSFGKIDLHLWATAVKRPPLAGSPGKPTEPYGVAELFRQCLETAEDFRQRTRQSSRRLLYTLLGVGGILGVMLGLAVVFILQHKSQPPGELANKVENFLFTEGKSPAERLKGAPTVLRQRLALLSEMRQDPGFSSLPKEDQEKMTARQAELDEYLAYLDRVLATRQPAAIGDERTLQATEDALRSKLALPHAEWSQTDAGKLQESRLSQIKALRRAVDEAESWYDALRTEGNRLWLFTGYDKTDGGVIDWLGWQTKVKELVAQAGKTPFRESDPVPGAEGLTYATVLRFDRVVEARNAAQEAVARLERVRRIVDALGLGGITAGNIAPLAIAVAPPFTLKDASLRVQELKKNYPQFDEQFRLANLPDALVPAIKQAARSNYERILEPARAEVLQHLRLAGKGNEEALGRWRALESWLANPEELKDWRILATTLVRLLDPERAEPDPVNELASFIKKDAFELNMKRLALRIPDDLAKRPSGDLTIFQQSAAGENTVSLAFEVLLDKQPDEKNKTVTYQLRPLDKNGLTYRPGDKLWAVLPLRDTAKRDEEWVFTWSRCRSEVYQFERLTREPRLHRKDQKATDGKIAEGVWLTVTQGSG